MKKTLLSDIIGGLGTPKTLDEAISQIFYFRNEPEERVKDLAYHVIRDFMAQKMAVAHFRVNESENDEAVIILQQLFLQLTNRPGSVMTTVKTDGDKHEEKSGKDQIKAG